MNQALHVGKQAAHLNIGCHVTPGVRIILKPGVNLPPDFALSVRDNIVRLVESMLVPYAEEFEWSNGQGIDVAAEQYRVRSWADTERDLESVRQAFAEAAKSRDAAMDADPNNGTYGMWSVDGIRHNTVTDASSAREALSKAIADGEVGDWEQATVTFLRPLAATTKGAPHAGR